MLFASFDFLLFFLPVLAAAWAFNNRPVLRLWLLLATSYFFYAAGAKPPGADLPPAWYYVGLLILSTLIDFTAGLGIERSQSAAMRRAWLWLSLLTNLGLLGYFKYTTFLLEVAGDVTSWLGVDAALPSLRLLLPIGISFYTFQSLSYTIDVWRGRLKAERSLLRFSVYVAFFPQLVAGPIVRAAELLPQFRDRLSLDADALNFAAFRICRGLLKKVVLGDFVAAYFADVVFQSPADYTSLENLVALYAFTLQIYADFSGYSDIAIGVARLLGFRLPENFDRPYQSQHVGEFWRRWHMTLSTWLRDYLFFPLGGSLGSPLRSYFNLWLTMFLVGMWHGASWNFVIYSNLQAFAMLFNRFNRRRRTGAVWGADLLAPVIVVFVLLLGLGAGALSLSWPTAVCFAGVGALLALTICLLPTTIAWAPFHVLLTFHFTVLTRVFFRAETLQSARTMIAKLLEWDGHGVREGLFRAQGLSSWLKAHGVANAALLWAAEWALLILIAGGLGYHFLPSRWLERPGQRLIAALPAPVLGATVAVIALLVSQLLNGPRANIYFAF